jgi:A/G-specific adenine glycosylase
VPHATRFEIGNAVAIRRALLAWYDRERRVLPWRAAPGRQPNPYHVWLSEIMLQQTTVAAVVPYFHRFIARWPTLADLAGARLADILHAWQGLGYYARAHNLRACAKAVMAEHGGSLPKHEAELLGLPGIGPYTAAAIAAIAFGSPATPVDGNVIRVIARLANVQAPLPGAKQRIAQLAAALTPSRRAGDFAQGLMDLGSAVCTPRRPTCNQCPLSKRCLGFAAGDAANLPRRAAKAKRPLRHAVAYLARRADGAVLFRQRPDNGLLAGMTEVPTTPWRARAWRTDEIAAHAPLPARWRRLPGLVKHSFTHFDLEVAVVTGHVGDGLDGLPSPKRSRFGFAQAGAWRKPEQFAELALPTLMKKLCRLAAGG